MKNSAITDILRKQTIFWVQIQQKYDKNKNIFLVSEGYALSKMEDLQS
jgi:hypothetical protein